MKIIPQLDEKTPLTGTETFLIESPLKNNADPATPSDWKAGKTFLSKIVDFVKSTLKGQIFETSGLSIHCLEQPDPNFATNISTYPVIDVATWQGIDNPRGEPKVIARFGAFNRFRGDDSDCEIELGPPGSSSAIKWSLDLANSHLNRLWFETRDMAGNRGIGLTIWENQGVTIGVGQPGRDINGAAATIGANSLAVAGYVQGSSLRIATNTISYSAAPPGNGVKGDICYNANPASGGFAGWILTDAGWKEFGAIA